MKKAIDLPITIIFCLGMLCALDERRIALLLAAALAGAALYRVLTKRAVLSFPHIPLAALPCLYLLSMAATGGITFYAAGQVLLMCVPFLASLCVPDIRGVPYVIITGLCFLAFASLLGLVLPFIPNTFTPPGYHSDPRLRMQSLLNYANTAGVLFGCGIFALFEIKTNRHLTLAKYLTFVLFTVCLFLTGSRFAIAQTAVLLAAYFIVRRKAKKTAVAAAACLLITGIGLVFYMPGLIFDSALVLRLIYWRDAAAGFAGNPLFGLGPEGYTFKIHEIQTANYVVMQVHNGFVQAAVDAGLPAMVMLLVIFVYALRRAWNQSLGIFFILLLLLFHSTVDIDLSFFPVLMLLGICTAVPQKKYVKKPYVQEIFYFAAFSIIIAGLYISAGENFYRTAEKAIRTGRTESAEQAYQSALRWMPKDFRTSYKLARFYIQEKEPKKAISLLLETDFNKFNKAVRSELLVQAYKNTGRIREWGAETLAQMEYAPRRQCAYTDRSVYLHTALSYGLLNEYEYENEYASLRAAIEASNESMHFLTRFLLERDGYERVLWLE